MTTPNLPDMARHESMMERHYYHQVEADEALKIAERALIGRYPADRYASEADYLAALDEGKETEDWPAALDDAKSRSSDFWTGVGEGTTHRG